MGHASLLYLIPNHQNISATTQSSPSGVLEALQRIGAI